MTHARLALLLASLLLAACAKPALYAPMRGEDVGYGERQIDGTHYQVWFAGNSATPRQTVQDYVLYRAAELTLDQGYDYFVLANRSTDAEHPDRGGGVSLGIGGFRIGGRGGISIGVGTGIPVGGSDPKYFGQADIALMKGKKPVDDADAYDAREVKALLEPRVTRPPAEGEAQKQ